MSQQSVLSLREEISFIQEPETNVMALLSPDHKITFGSTKSGLRNVLYSLTNEGGSFEKLNSYLEADEGIFAVSKLSSYLEKFSQLGWLCHYVFAGDDLLAAATPISKGIQFTNIEIFAESRYLLSRFAYIHRVNEQMILESPLSKVQIQLFNWQGIAIINQLAKPFNCLELATQIPNLSIDITKKIIGLLANAQMISESSVKGNTLKQEDPILAQWEFHDLLFHTRSRMGRHSNRVGGTYRFLGKLEPLPAIKPKMSNSVVRLYKPDLESLKSTDIPFTQVLETRKSIRKYGESPITVQQLGEFLYRTARVKEIIKTQRGELASRPYPSAGSLYELELYPVINQCQNISSGIYHYRPLEHQLCFLSEKTKDLSTLIKTASQSLGKEDTPQIIIVITAKFQRVSWKYESIAYSLILEHVGVLHQTMYLVATAMNLAPCGIGRGDSDLSAKIIGCNYYAETSIGEFALGSKGEEYPTLR
jgi:oxazoline/thiazoline dehydrogenase